MDCFQLGRETSTDDKSFEFAVKLGLINISNKNCNNCGNIMKVEAGKKRHGINKRWRCQRKSCRTSISIFKNTIFHGIKISISQILQLIFCYSTNCKLKFTMEMCDVSKPTAISWYQIFNRIGILAVMNDRNNMIGGEGMTVEIDETHIFKRKYNVGRILVSQSVWVIGGICRETKNVFLKVSTVRNRQTLMKIISDNVQPGTRIITDCWCGYSRLNDIGFNHFTVNHRYNFLSPDDPTIHTNTI